MRTPVAMTGLLAMVSLTLAASSASAAKPVLSVHGGSITHPPIPMTWCDEVEGTAVETDVVQIRADARGNWLQNARSTTVFTATATARSIEYSSAGLVRVSEIDNGDGTVTFVSKGAGVKLLFKIANGPVFRAASGGPLRSAGAREFRTTIDASTGELLSFTESVHGPDPFDDDAVCELTVAYLLDL
jgi:hypothetical protein